LFGLVNSLQFTAMNTVTLKDLSGAGASSGNSLLSMVQMLSMSLGVAAAGGLLTTFEDLFGRTRTILSFHRTYICVGVMTAVWAWIFWQLPTEEAAVPEALHAPEAKPTEAS